MKDTQREKQAPSREPDVGFSPGTPGSCSGWKAGTKPLSPPGVPLLMSPNQFFPDLHFHPFSFAKPENVM